MQIKTINIQPELKLIALLETSIKKPRNHFFLLVRFSKTSLNIESDNMLSLFKEFLGALEGALYFLQDGDLVIKWTGAAQETCKKLESLILGRYGNKVSDDIQKELFTFYDSHEDGQAFISECQYKIDNVKTVTVASRDFVETAVESLDDYILETLSTKISKRPTRKNPEILIVEDQTFSVKLLLGILEKDYKCYVAKNAAKAILQYCLHAPDIVLMDIELPESNGHKLTRLFTKLDPEAHIIMVSGTHNGKDIETALINQVKGFVSKPYKKDKED